MMLNFNLYTYNAHHVFIDCFVCSYASACVIMEHMRSEPCFRASRTNRICSLLCLLFSMFLRATFLNHDAQSPAANAFTHATTDISAMCPMTNNVTVREMDVNSTNGDDDERRRLGNMWKKDRNEDTQRTAEHEIEMWKWCYLFYWLSGANTRWSQFGESKDGEKLNGASTQWCVGEFRLINAFGSVHINSALREQLRIFQ